jgi:hypothetical protein
MTISINTAARNAAIDAVRVLPDAGAGPAVLRIYSGAKPATPATAPSGTLLVAITLNDPSFGAGAAGVSTIVTSPTISAAAAATGTAGYFRILTSTEAAGTGLGVIDGTVTATGGGGDLTIDSTSIVSAVTVTVTGGTLTMPA